MFKRAVIFFLLIFPVFFLGQEIACNYYESKNINKISDRKFGNTMPHGFELSWGKRKTDTLGWERRYGYPMLGWKLNCMDHRNDKLGQSFLISRFIEISLMKNRYLEWNISVSHGIMYATRIYSSNDVVSGRFNNAISQRLNFSAEIASGFYVRLNGRFSIGVQSSINHFSNGALSQPNDGLNIWSVAAKIKYLYSEKNSYRSVSDKKWNDGKLKVNMNFGVGVSQMDPENKAKYPLYTSMVYLDKQLNELSKIGGGFDLYMNTGVKYRINNDPWYKGVDYKRVGFSLGHELLIHRLGISTYLGYYFYSPYPNKMFYQKYGLKYFVTKNFFVAANLKIHGFEISDELSWGVGVRF